MTSVLKADKDRNMWQKKKNEIRRSVARWAKETLVAWQWPSRFLEPVAVLFIVLEMYSIRPGYLYIDTPSL